MGSAILDGAMRTAAAEVGLLLLALRSSVAGGVCVPLSNDGDMLYTVELNLGTSADIWPWRVKTSPALPHSSSPVCGVHE